MKEDNGLKHDEDGNLLDGNKIDEEENNSEKVDSEEEKEVETGPVELPFGYKSMKDKSQFSVQYSRSINPQNAKKHMLPGSTIGTTEKHVSNMPAPKKAPAKKKAAEAPKPPPDGEEKKDGDSKPEEEKKKPARVKKPPPPMMPMHEALPQPDNLSVNDALKSAVGWSNSNNISKKFSVGTLTTAPYSEKVRVFQEMNTLAEEKSNILPMSEFQAKH